MLQDTYKGRKITVQHAPIVTRVTGAKHGPAGRAWQVRINGVNVTDKVVKLNMTTEEAVMEAARAYLDKTVR